MPHNHLIFCCPLLLLPSIFLSFRVFSNASALHIKGPMDWIFSFSISPSNKYPGLISFRIDWLDLLAVQGVLLSHESSLAPQFESINSSVFSLLYGSTLTSMCVCFAAQLCLTFCDLMDCSLPGSFVHGDST